MERLCWVFASLDPTYVKVEAVEASDGRASILVRRTLRERHRCRPPETEAAGVRGWTLQSGHTFSNVPLARTLLRQAVSTHRSRRHWRARRLMVRRILDAMRGVLPEPYNVDEGSWAAVSPLAEADLRSLFGDVHPAGRVLYSNGDTRSFGISFTALSQTHTQHRGGCAPGGAQDCGRAGHDRNDTPVGRRAAMEMPAEELEPRRSA